MLRIFLEWHLSGNGLLVTPLSGFSRIVHYHILRWTLCGSHSDSLSCSWASLLCIWPSQGVFTLHVQIHGSPEWINDPSSNKFHTLECFPVSHTKGTLRFSIPFFFLFCFVLLYFSSSAFSSFCGFVYSPILGTCSWNGFNSFSGCPQGFLFPYPLLLLNFWLIHCLKFQIPHSAADPLPADFSIIQLVVLLWLS